MNGTKGPAKQGQEQRTVQQQPPPFRRDLDLIALGTLVGVVAILMITFSNMRDVERLDRTVSERLGKLEDQIAQLNSRPAPAAAAAAPAGAADPSRVYTVKNVPDAPAKGPANAPVLIAEFSDFQ